MTRKLPKGLARGTYEYIEKLKAWACMLSEPERFGLTLPASDAFEILFPCWYAGQDAALADYAADLFRGGPLEGLNLYGASFWLRKA